MPGRIKIIVNHILGLISFGISNKQTGEFFRVIRKADKIKKYW